MKRLILLLLALALLAAAPAASAEGALSVVQEDFHVVSAQSLYGYLYARVQNTGDAPIRIDGGEFEIMDPDGNALCGTKSLWRYAEYLQPGEYTYVYFYLKIDGAETPDQVGDYSMSIDMREASDKVTFRLPQESSYEPGVQEGSWSYDYITTTLTNDTDRTAFDVTIVRALLDAEGSILYIDSDNMYSHKGILPGSSIVLRRAVNSSFAAYFEENGYEPASVDAIAYFYTKEPEAYARGGAAAGDSQEPAAEPERESPVEYLTLKNGSKGEDVRAMQQRLKDLGYLAGKVDGDFGKGTEKAVTAFQKKAGLPETGVADDATQKALFADDAPAA